MEWDRRSRWAGPSESIAINEGGDGFEKVGRRSSRGPATLFLSGSFELLAPLHIARGIR